MYAEILDRKQPAIAARLQNRKSKSGGSFPISSKKKGYLLQSIQIACVTRPSLLLSACGGSFHR
jgi:hypothetical protein